jgi:UDP-N-acetylmuramyl pentapeptide synthase
MTINFQKMQSIIIYILKILARLTLMRYHPRIIGVTGSVGKTSTRRAIACVLQKDFSVRESLENYNNELGVPLSILGERSGNKNLFDWLLIFIKSLVRLIYTEYPEILILEIATDRPGDIKYLMNLVGRLEMAVITNVGITHLEFFASPQALMREKLTILNGVGEDGKVIANNDDSGLMENIDRTKYRVVSFGFDEKSLVKASEFQVIEKDGAWGVNFKVHYQGTVVPFFIPNTLGRPVIYSALVACAVGLNMSLNLADMSATMQKFIPPPGRLRFLPGIKHTQIIDDSYNSAPDSAVAALEALGLIARKRKIVVFAGMAELGKEEETGHKQVAQKIIESKVDAVFLIGNLARMIEKELKRKKFLGLVYWYATSDDACLPVQNEIKEGDTVLVKGSQSERMEKVVKEIMNEPLKAKRLLVRQNPEWLTR